MKKSLLWLAVALFVSMLSVPAALADGIPHPELPGAGQKVDLKDGIPHPTDPFGHRELKDGIPHPWMTLMDGIPHP